MNTTKIFFVCLIGSNVFFDSEKYIECTYKGHKAYFETLLKEGLVLVDYACPFFLTEKDALECAEGIISTIITNNIINSSQGVIPKQSLESIVEYTNKGFKNLTKKDIEAFNENVFNSSFLKDYVFVRSLEVKGEVKDNQMYSLIFDYGSQVGVLDYFANKEDAEKERHMLMPSEIENSSIQDIVIEESNKEW